MKPVGVAYAELNLDATPMELKLKNLNKTLTEGTIKVEAAYQSLGIKSDQVFNMMKANATAAADFIKNKTLSSTEEIMKAQSAAATKISAINQQMMSNDYWKNLGIRSTAAINDQIQLIKTSAASQQAIYSKGSQDWINIEHAKNAKLKELNKEMVGHHEMSMASMMRTVLRFYAVYYVASQALSVLSKPFIEGFKAVEEYNTSVASTAAMVVSFAERQEGMDLATQWKEAYKYSSQLIPILEQIAAKTLLSGTETIALNEALARSSVFLNASNAEQLEGFTRLSNALPLMTKGQDIMRQINTEIRSLMTGANAQSSMLLQNLRAIDPELDKHLDTWREEGTVLQNIGTLLEGFGPATSVLENQWTAVKTTLATTVTQTLRGGMLNAYNEIIVAVKSIGSWLEGHKETLINSIQVSWILIKTTVSTIWTALTGISPVLGDMSVSIIAAQVAFGEILIVVKNIASVLTNLTVMAWDFAQLIGQSLVMMTQAATGHIEAAKDTGKMIDDLVIDIKKRGSEIGDVFTGKIGKDLYDFNEEIKNALKITEELGNTTKEAFNFKAKGGEISAEDDSFDDALKKIDSLREAWEDTKISLEAKIKIAAFDDSNWGKYQEQLIKNQEETDKLKDKYADLYGAEKQIAYALIDQAQEAKDAAAQNEYLSETQEDLVTLADKLAARYLKVQNAYEKSKSKMGKEEKYAKEQKDAIESIDAALKEHLITYDQWKKDIEDVNEHYENLIAKEMAKEQEDFYKDLIGYEDEYYEAALKNIEAQAQAWKEAGIEEVAIAKWAADEKGKLEQELFEKKTKYIADGFGDLSSSFSGIASLYAEGSEAAKTWTAASNAMLVAQKAVAVVNAVATIANQGLGDPYTAFARIAAMAAAMGALLASIGASIGGTSSSSTSSLPASTVLGAEAGTGSSSISNSYELLKDTYSMEYSELSELNASMKALNSNISGLVSNILQYGIGDTASWDLEGTSSGAITKILTYGLEVMGGIVDFISGDFLIGVSDKITEYVTKLTNKLFGGETSYKIKESGLALGSTSVADLMSGEDVSAKAYAKIKKTVEGGWFSSDKTSYSTKYSALSSSTSDLISSVYSDISGTLVALTTELGTSMSKTLAYTFQSVKLNLKGMTGEEINDTLSEYFSNIGDKAVEALFGSMLSGYQEVGEGLLETAVRLIQDKAIITDMLEKTNQKFSGSISKVIAFSETLIDLAGDLDTLQDAFSTYYSAFISEKEQAADLKADLSEVLSDLGKTLPSTRAGYKSLLESLNLTTSSGQAAYVALLSYAEAADSYYSYLEEIAEAKTSLTIELLEAQGKTTEALAMQRKAELAAMDESLRALQKQVWAAQDAADATEELSDAMEEVADRTKTITDWLNSLAISTSAPATSVETYQEQYKTYLANAGTTEGLSDFLSFASTYLEFMQDYLSSGNYKDFYASVMADVNELQAENILGSYASGTDYVPETGIYQLHQGEKVVSAGSSDSAIDSEKMGQIIGAYVSAALENSEGQPTQIILDGKVIAEVMIKQGKTNPIYIKSIQAIAGNA